VVEKNRRVQTQRRGAVWSVEPEVDQMDAEDVLSMLLWSWLSGAE